MGDGVLQGSLSSPGSAPARSGAARRAARLAPAIAFIAAFALRLPLMNAGLFHHDEVQLARAIEESQRQHRILPAVKGRYGAVLLGLAVYVPYHAATGRNAERAVPFVGIATGALLVAFALLLARELTGDGLAGALAAAFTFGGTLFLTSSSTGKENAPQIAFVVLAFWLLARGAARGSIALRIAAISIFAFALTIHEGGVVLVPAFALGAAALELRDGRGWKTVALDLGALCAALAIPVKLSIWNELQRNIFGTGGGAATFRGLFSPGLPEALGDTLVAFGIPIVAFAAIGAVAAIVRRRETSLLALLPWPLAILYFGNVDSYTPRYLLYVLPPVVVLGGAGAALVLRRWVRRGLPLVATAVAVAACAPGVARAYPLLAARAAGGTGPKAMAVLINERTEPDAIVLCQDDSPFLEYYAPGRTLLKQPLADPETIAEFVRDLVKRARAGARIYADTQAFAYDDEGWFSHFLQYPFALVPVGSVVNESFHRSELQDMSFPDTLYRLELR